MSRPRHPAEIDGTIVALSQRGLSTRRIAAETGLSASSVRRVLAEIAGDPRQNPGDGRTVTAGVIAAPEEMSVSGPSTRPALGAVRPLSDGDHDAWDRSTVHPGLEW